MVCETISVFEFGPAIRWDETEALDFNSGVAAEDFRRIFLYVSGAKDYNTKNIKSTLVYLE